jgi:hypothetical protein
MAWWSEESDISLVIHCSRLHFVDVYHSGRFAGLGQVDERVWSVDFVQRCRRHCWLTPGRCYLRRNTKLLNSIFRGRRHVWRFGNI